jgi:hypothetical protein
MQDYPMQYIREKLVMAQGLATAGSCLVSQNPAGWLRKAIEEDYAPPSISHRYRQRHIREKKDTKPVHAEPREQQMPKEEYRQVKEEASSEAAETTEPLPEQGLPRLVGEDGLTTADVWSKALEQLKEALPLGEAEARLRGTTLVQVTDTAARILVPSAFALAWLERRLYGQIAQAIKGVVGKELDLQFIAAS